MIVMEVRGLLAEMGRSAIAGLKKEVKYKTSLRKGEVGKKEVER